MTNEESSNQIVQRSHLLARAVNRRAMLQGMAGVGAMAAVTLSGASAFAASGPSGAAKVRRSQDATPVKGGELTVALTGQPDTLDPQKAGVYTSLQIYDNIFSKLLYIDVDLNFLPGLASAWTNTSDTEWEFTLVENAVFHNGDKFTSADVVNTWTRMNDPATASSNATLFSPVTAVTPDGDYKVKFTLGQSYGPFLPHLASSFQIISKRAMEDTDPANDPARKPIGTGPFKFVEWVTDDHITVERWDQFYETDHPYLDKIIFRGTPVDESRMTALETGEIQWADAIPLQKVSDVRDNGELNYYTAPIAGLPDYLAFNCTAAPFDNVKLRQAVAWAIDRPAVLQLAYSGVGEIANQEVASGNAWATDTTTYSNTPDLDKAKALLAESGFDTSQKLTYLGLPEYPELLRTGEVLKENLSAIGIEMDIENQDVGTWAQNFFAHNYQLTSGYWSSIIDPDVFYNQLLVSTSGSNVTGYSSPQMDDLVNQARLETDFEKRKALYQQCRDLTNTDVPLTFVHYELLNYATAKNVMGTVVYPSMELRFKDVWIQP